MTREKVIYDERGIVKTLGISVENGVEIITNWVYVDGKSGLSTVFGIEYHPHHKDYQKFRSKFGE